MRSSSRSFFFYIKIEQTVNYWSLRHICDTMNSITDLFPEGKTAMQGIMHGLSHDI
jgi:hypothetical protein